MDMPLHQPPRCERAEAGEAAAAASHATGCHRSAMAGWAGAARVVRGPAQAPRRERSFAAQRITGAYTLERLVEGRGAGCPKVIGSQGGEELQQDEAVAPPESADGSALHISIAANSGLFR